MPTVEPYYPLRDKIAGVSIAELANRFGTPAYVYDAAKIIERVNDLKQFDAIRYAQKACSNIAILDLVRRHGVVVDAVSAGEIHRAMKAGYVPAGGKVSAGHPDVIYTADIFDREALKPLSPGTAVNCGSPEMLDQLGERPGRNITASTPASGTARPENQHRGEQPNTALARITDDCLRADRHGLAVTGIHMHIGSGTDFEHQPSFSDGKAAQTVGRTITTITAGGDC
jgi:diaminopimelate decarboxylase